MITKKFEVDVTQDGDGKLSAVVRDVSVDPHKELTLHSADIVVRGVLPDQRISLRRAVMQNFFADVGFVLGFRFTSTI